MCVAFIWFSLSVCVCVFVALSSEAGGDFSFGAWGFGGLFCLIWQAHWVYLGTLLLFWEPWDHSELSRVSGCPFQQLQSRQGT